VNEYELRWLGEDGRQQACIVIATPCTAEVLADFLRGGERRVWLTELSVITGQSASSGRNIAHWMGAYQLERQEICG